MNPELWQKPYDYSFEEREVKERFKRYFDGLATSKRMILDPFKNTTTIRCTYSGCKVRYPVHNLLFANMEIDQPKDFFRFTAGVHDHFLTELNFNRISAIGAEAAVTMCKNGKELFICESCGYAPFPKPMGSRSNWQHDCNISEWRLSLNKPNTMTWRAGMWVLQIDYVQKTWHWLDQQNGRANYDPTNSCWIIADSLADEVEKACKNRFANFKRGLKPAQRPGGGRPVTAGNLNVKKLQAAEVIVSIISRTGNFRAIQSRLHPDRFTDPAQKAQATKDFQELQEAYSKWEKS